MRRKSVSLADDAVAALERRAREYAANVSCVIEAAAAVIDGGGAPARAVARHLVPDRRGGRRSGSGRPRRDVT
ncbi:MAG: hypothetical protein ABR972_13655 [Acidimicrobiales bacterium]